MGSVTGPHARPRPYTKRRRAATQGETRARILAATQALVPTAGDSLPVTAIAEQAGVAVQTIYDQFGSKGGLLIALIGEVQERAGLFKAFPWVFSSPHGEEAMRRMISASVGLWDGAWPFVAFILRAQRVDRVVAREMAFIDRLRHEHFWAITARLAAEGRIRAGHDADWAADVSFALTTPTVYEELAVRRHVPVADAVRAISDAVFGAILEPGREPVLDPPPDWPALEAAAFERAKAGGSDPDRLSPEWQGVGQTAGRTSSTKCRTAVRRP